MSTSSPTIVDNNSPDIPFYINPQYVNVTDHISTQAYEYVQTAQLSAYNQSLADITTPRWSFSYRFQGTRITVFGVVIPFITGPLPAAQYAVDGASLNTSTVPNTTRTLTGVKFYTSEYFPYGFHTLTVNVTTATDNAPYLFDYLAVDTADPPASTSASSSSFSSTASSSSQTSSSASPSGSDTALHAEGAAKSSAPTGAIVGGVIGGVVLLAAIAVGAWWLWKKNRTYDQSTYAYAKTGQYDGPDPHVDAYTYPTPDAFSSHTHAGGDNMPLYSDAVTPMMSISGHRPSLPPVSQHTPAPISSKASLQQSLQRSQPQSQYFASQPSHSEYSNSQPSQTQYSVSQHTSHYPQSASVVAEAPSSSLTPALSPPIPISGAARKAAEARLEAPRSPEAGGSDLSASIPPPYAP